MPYQEKDYHQIPHLIRVNCQSNIEAQKTFIDALSEDELRYLITSPQNPNWKSSWKITDDQPTAFHALAASSENYIAVNLLLDKFLENQSRKGEAKAESQKKILDEVAHLTMSEGSNLLHLLSFRIEFFFFFSKISAIG